MPIIALPKIALTPDAPAPVLDQQRRPTVDNSAVRQGVAELGRAQKMPEISGDAMAAPYEALGAVGRSLSKAGSVIGALSQKQQEAEQDIQVATADNTMQKERADFDAWKMENPDPSSWAAERQKRFDALKTKVLDENDNLHPGSREQIGLRLTRFDGQWAADVTAGAAKETFSQAKSVWLSAADRANEAQDKAGFEESVNTMLHRGYLYPHEAEALRQNFVKTGERKEREAKANAFDSFQNTAITFAAANGEDIALKNIESGLLDTPGHESTPAQREQVRNVVQAFARDRAAQARDILANGIASGDLNSPEKIDAAVKGTPLEKFVTPEILSAAHHYARQYDAQAAQIDREQNGPENFADMYNKVAAYERSSFKDDKEAQLAAFNLRLEIRKKVGPDDDGWLSQKLWQKSNAVPPPFKASDPIKQLVNDRMDRIFDPRAGAFKSQWAVPMLDTKGAPVIDKMTGKPKTQWVTNEDNARTAAIAHAQIRQELDDWMKQNPEKAKMPAEVSKAIGRLLPNGYKESVLDSISTRFSNQPQASASPGNLPPDLVSQMKKTEGFNPHSYGDYKQTSIGYGTRAKFSGETLTETEADARLRQELSSHAAIVDDAARAGGYTLTPGQRNALISFDFNTGQGAHLLSTAGGSLAEVKRRLLLYTKAGGSENAGLVDRRKMEAGWMGL